MVFLTGVMLQLFGGGDAWAREPVKCRPVDNPREVARRGAGNRHRRVQCTQNGRPVRTARSAPPRRTVRRSAPPARRRAPVRRPVRRAPVARRAPPVARPPANRSVVVRRRGPKYNRENTVAIGLTGGSVLSGNNDVGLFTDGGVGGWFRARPRGPFAVQLDVSHYFGVTRRPLLQQARQQTQLGGSVMWFATSRAPLTPYVLGGAAYAHRSVQDQTFGNDFPVRSNLFGLQGGGGLEVALGRSAVLDFEARYVGYLGRDSNDPVGSLTATVGIGTHF
ncbi:MAG: hypothetical protein AAGA48_28415 [Myxococcota bacterium]